MSQVDIQDLNLSIISSRLSSKTKKSKGKGAGHELEILTGAHLRLKTGTLYGMLGRNGTGKSSECEYSFVKSYKVYYSIELAWCMSTILPDA